jgi:hypothetical protein
VEGFGCFACVWAWTGGGIGDTISACVKLVSTIGEFTDNGDCSVVVVGVLDIGTVGTVADPDTTAGTAVEFRGETTK